MFFFQRTSQRYLQFLHVFKQLSQEPVVVCRHGEELHVARLQLCSLRERSAKNKNFYRQTRFAVFFQSVTSWLRSTVGDFSMVLLMGMLSKVSKPEVYAARSPS